MPFVDLVRQVALADWLALLWFVVAWWGYALFARKRATGGGSLLATTNRYRHLWMLQTTLRENRVIDGVVVQNLSTSPSFFASTTILIIGGLLAVLVRPRKPRRSSRKFRSPPAPRHSPSTSNYCADGRVRVRVLSLHMVDAPVHFRRVADRLGARSEPSSPVAQRRARSLPTARAASSASPPKPSTTDCARTTWRSRPSCGSFRRWHSPSALRGIVYLLYQREFQSEVLDVLRQ